MFPLQPTLRRIATNPDQREHEAAAENQTGVRHVWVWQPTNFSSVFGDFFADIPQVMNRIVHEILRD